MTPLRCANAPSTARSFLSLVNRRSYSATSLAQSSVAPLEFLVPRTTLRASRSSPPSSNKIGVGKGNCFSITPASTRNFSVSASHRATVCVQNPLNDEDGNEMMLEITPRAAKRLTQIMTKDANPNLALRIQVESGGCHGFQYLMSLVTIPEDGTEGRSEVVREDDTIFQFADEETVEGAATDAPKIILDEPSLELLKGSKVDFTMELIGSQFKIVDNPYATTSCGCGTSFDIKM